MEIAKIRLKRNDLEQAIEQLIYTFIQETDVEIAEIRLQPAVYSPGNIEYAEVTPAKVDVELVI